MTRPASLSAENDYLRAQLRQLQDALGTGLRWPAEWKLSPQETALLGVLVSREIATRDAVMYALYGDDPDPPSERLLKVLVYKLRRKLAPRGFGIVTQRGHGLMMPVEQRARLRAAALK
jgi:two-component system cell cycle response regulator CtrA